jgi:hypothetical protein
MRNPMNWLPTPENYFSTRRITSGPRQISRALGRGAIRPMH